MPERRTIPIVEHHEVFITLTSTGQPLIWKVDEHGHVSPLDEREVGDRDA